MKITFFAIALLALFAVAYSFPEEDDMLEEVEEVDDLAVDESKYYAKGPKYGKIIGHGYHAKPSYKKVYVPVKKVVYAPSYGKGYGKKW